MGILDPSTWSKEGVAQWTYDTLDPYYGEGGTLEPVTVIVDPDRTVKEEYVEPMVEEYVEPLVDYGEDVLEDLKEDTAKLLKWGAAIGLLYVALK